ncbi:MaoC family dehydratase [Variovorax rhizosphaerae]|uniref:MaoC family dehydratase n=1 Tax=Variovorax rhizosphaerae TaxID=1836200 RepID=A0ABU8WEA8_9BURK
MAEAIMQITGLNDDTLQVGDALPAFETEPISRLSLALYCGASGDHNPIHVDTDFARAAGQKDVFAHGMLSMAYLARLLTNWVPQAAVREFGVRFVAITQVGDRIRCRATVVDKHTVDGERRARLVLETVDQNGQVKLAGDAVVALS